ncbi:MAG: hypothetical protein QOF55_2209 [Thermoleophilaceae bacterium]|nr:hypothetical protein [Thermoleophilaceae bacterium]
MLAVRLIEQIGSYAGLAAIPGLAVLSALYFSQARDVKRLRDWAGRAPERSAEQAMGGRVVAQPQTQAQPAGVQPAKPPPVPGAAPAAKPAVAAAAGAAAASAAGPALATGAATPAGAAAAKAATPAGEATGEDAAKEGEAAKEPAKAGEQGAEATPNGQKPAEAEAESAAPATGKPAALTPAAVASAAAGAAKSGGGSATGTVTRPGPPGVAAGRPSAAGAPGVRRPIPRVPSSQTSILTPTSAAREPWQRRARNRLPAARYVALMVAGALVLGGGAAFGITQLASNDGGGGGKSASRGGASAPSSSGGNSRSGSKKDPNVKATPTVDPASVTVTVVNGTTVPNLARDTAAKLSQLGFQIGNKVTGTGSLAAAESVVQYKPGAEAEARAVAAKLHISQRQPADADALGQAGPAQVIVVLGADQAPGG